ncbi:hypothetical protein [Kribbella sp. NPDC049227]|uniref:hypothetical protein n=1 Tax=Kribbella sp. NPDC049227 TaxID=3364113 RepID=UPI0037165105
MAEAESTGGDERPVRPRGTGDPGFQPGDEVAAAGELGGFWRGKIPVGTPGVIDEIDEAESSTPVFTVTFTIEQDDLLIPHQTTVSGLSITELSRK